MRFRGLGLWPAVVVTLLTGAGFAGLKFVLIGELAFDYDDKTTHLSIGWMDRIVHRCFEKGAITEAVSQGLAAVLTLGVLVGYLVNAPLAGAWRCAWLFMVSCAGIAAGTVLTLWLNPWILAGFVGIAYGAACAARGKVIPLLSRATRRPNTQVSGFINASLVIGLLTGTVMGTMLREQLPESMRATRHLILFAFMLVAIGLSVLVRPPEPRRIPFRTGMRELASGTSLMLRQQWPLLVGGGLAWGIASAASLAVYIDAIDRLEFPPTDASFMAIFAAIGAIVGNLGSHYFTRRRHVVLSFVALAICIGIYPHVIHGWVSAAVMMIFVGAFFAAPTNVLDARVLALAGAAGLAGRGSTVMSLIHNVFIFLVGFGLAVPLFLGVMTPTQQFYFLAFVTVITILVSSRAHLRDYEVRSAVNEPGVVSSAGGSLT
ncbi:MAG: hypothetical protein H0V44_12130 [Planctomycetes bacterium]|nr:hypothetical protein [Planctomycetota bacterium]